MAKKKKRKKKTSEELSSDNELMKLKMMAEFGGDFVGAEDIPPEIENQFLKQIISFHKLHDKSKMTTVYKFIGEPEYNHVHDLSDKEIDKELKLLTKTMEKNGVSLTTLAATNKREIYRFITEELFKQEIEDIKVKGWIHQFVYEDFHPNPDYDVRQVVSFCVESFFAKNMDILSEYYSEEMKDSIGLSMEPDDLFERIKNFKEDYHQLKLVKFELTTVQIDTKVGTAHVIANVSYKTQRSKGQKFKTGSTAIELNLERSNYADNWWEIKQLNTNLF